MNSSLVIKQTETMGRGVFARKAIKRGDFIEDCPVIFIATLNEAEWKGTSLEEYVFQWGIYLAIALGYGSLYNHSHECNAKHVRMIDEKIMRFIAIRDIKRGEQILIDYGWLQNDYTFPKEA